MNHFVKRDMEENFGKSVRNSKIYIDDGSDDSITSVAEHIPTYVEKLDAVSAVFKYANGNDKVTLLNFASFVVPGGGCLRGAMAQEECICYESNLYYVLSNFMDFYEENRENVNLGLYSNKAIYSPGIKFAREINYGGKQATYDQPLLNKAECDVITCTAPFTKFAMAVNGVSYHDCVDAMRDRIRFVLDVAKDNNVDTLILGAFGCGVFGNDPIDAAKTFKELLESGKYDFKKIIFAIPDDKNLDCFRFVFE